MSGRHPEVPEASPLEGSFSYPTSVSPHLLSPPHPPRPLPMVATLHPRRPGHPQQSEVNQGRAAGRRSAVVLVTVEAMEVGRRLRRPRERLSYGGWRLQRWARGWGHGVKTSLLDGVDIGVHPGTLGCIPGHWGASPDIGVHPRTRRSAEELLSLIQKPQWWLVPVSNTRGKMTSS